MNTIGSRKNSDLTGLRFGHLTVIERVPNHVTSGGNTILQWKCLCDCGTEKIIKACHLRDGHVQSCGSCGLTGYSRDLINLTGQRFGYLTVTKQVANHVSSGGNSFVAWECVCDCGNTKVVTAGHLRTGHTKSCGKCGKYDHQSNFTGQRFGRLVVLKRCDEWYTYPNGTRDFKWRCKCDCGNIVVVRGNVLRNKRFSQSCGCWRNEESINPDDMIGHVFGLCRVESKADRIRVSDTSTVDAWNCVCSCGNHFVARGPQLRIGNKVSCGCLSVSKWELWTAEFLDARGIKYVPQKTYDDLRGVGGCKLSYDFCIDVNGSFVLIECQGKQHYQPVDFFGGQTTYERQIEHDIRKQEYARKRGIPLIEMDCSSDRLTHDMYCSMLGDSIEKYL